MLIGTVSSQAIAQEMHTEMQPSTTEKAEQFQRIEQPLWAKVAVTAGGLGLIGLELWWFLLSKPKSRKATTQGGVQEVTVMVDGGYEPSQIVVQVGQPVRLNFDRKDPSSCLEEVWFPDFRITQVLPLNQTTAIEFIPTQPGRYEFTCGMNMFRGVVEVQGAGQERAIAPISAESQPVDDSAHHHLTHPAHYVFIVRQMNVGLAAISCQFQDRAEIRKSWALPNEDKNAQIYPPLRRSQLYSSPIPKG
ncbi:cupredoxin domain-containing protein [Leptolyngbya sp. O-77]|uniref:cupredoxin domain-containing protein n=1 Tax=Leptolyngbya sp. O-77 TaxID=1080068 RepID=UPI001CECF797|nr:cupredoxin domain-containing protein [Leptolyngbya sp. O-77]